MEKEIVNELALEQLERCKKIFSDKSKEYALDTDRLSSFKQGAKLQNITPKQCLLGMMTKHIISIYDMVRTNKEYDLHLWSEKITDIINYLILLKALVVEEKDIPDVLPLEE